MHNFVSCFLKKTITSVAAVQSKKVSTDVILLFTYLFVHLWLCCAACGILVPRPGMEPMPPAVGGEGFTTGRPGKPLQMLSG